MIAHRVRAINSRAPKLSQNASLQQESSLEMYYALPAPRWGIQPNAPRWGGGADSAPLPNSRTNRRSEAGEAAIESPE